MRLSLLATAAAVCALTLSACGGDDSDDKPEGKDSPSQAQPSDGKTSFKPEDLPTGKQKPRKQDLGEATICKALDAGAVGDVIDATLKRGKIANNTCAFSDPNDPVNTYVGVSQVTLEAAGGTENVPSTLAELVTGTPEQLTGVGDVAYLLVGQTPSGQDAAAGVVVVDDAVVSVGFPVTGGVKGAEKARQQVTDLLALVTESL